MTVPEDDAIGAIDWASYTRLPQKPLLYARETYFREGLGDALEVLGLEADLLLRRAGLFLVKPDGLVFGRAAPAVAFLVEQGFVVVAVETLTFSAHEWRELWRFQLTAATLDRLAVNDLVLPHPALLLLLRYDGEPDVPASVHLSRLKGSADLALQEVGSMRHVLGQPNRIISFVHVANEPADVVRELGVVLRRRERRRVLRALADGVLAAADRTLLDAVLDRSDREARPLDVRAALDRAVATLEHVEPAAAVTRARSDLERMLRGERIAWREFERAWKLTGAELDHWDLALLGTSFIVYDEPGHPKVIEGVDPDLWRGDQPVEMHVDPARAFAAKLL